MAEWFGLLGRCAQGFTGIMPLSWSEIDAFLRSMRIDAKSWESEALRRMSIAYVNMYGATSDNHTIDPPILPDDETLKRLQAANGRHMKQVMKGA